MNKANIKKLNLEKASIPIPCSIVNILNISIIDINVLLGYYSSMFVTAFIFCYIVIGRHIINTPGSYMGGSCSNINLIGFYQYCFFIFFLPLIVGAAICTIFSSRAYKQNFVIIPLVYVISWLIAVTYLADDCAINWGNTWQIDEVFIFFVFGNFYIALLLLLTGWFVNKLYAKLFNCFWMLHQKDIG